MQLEEIQCDETAFLKSVLQNEQVMNFTLDNVFSDNELSAFIDNVQKNRSSPARTWFAYKVTNGADTIGFADIEIIRKTPVGGIAEIGYLLLPAFWHQGFGTAIAKRLINICFQDLNLHKAVASCNEHNTASWKIMENCGMTREGCLINQRYKHGSFVNELKYGILNPQYS